MRYTVADCYKYGRAKLDGCKLNPADANFLLPLALKTDKNNLPLDMPVSKKKYNKYCKLIRLRCKHMSMDKIIGFTEFMNVTIPFSHNVLTPRQETEILVDMIIKDNKSRKNIKVLDLCTGSGCIGISIAKELCAEVTLSDISKSALKEASRNARLNNVKVACVHSDLFDNISNTFDIIVSNPPYIPTCDVQTLEPEVLGFDPVLALDGGEDGLDFYRRIAIEAPKYLNPNGKLYLEIGIDEGEKIKDIFSPYFQNISVIKDYGGIDRFVIAEKRENNNVK